MTGQQATMPAPESSDADQLVVPADLHLLGQVREWVRERAARGDFSDRDFGDIDLAVTEAVSNVIRHAYGEDSRHEVSVRAGPEGSNFVISIVDSGPPFLGIAATPDLDGPQTGGYGLHIICAVMDEATWTRLPDGRNELRLVRQLPRPHA